LLRKRFFESAIFLSRVSQGFVRFSLKNMEMNPRVASPENKILKKK